MKKIRTDALSSFLAVFFAVLILLVVVVSGLASAYGEAVGLVLYLLPPLFSGALAYLHTYQKGRIALLDEQLQAMDERLRLLEGGTGAVSDHKE